MDSIDIEVLNVLFFQQLLDSAENERWDEAAMALFKLQAIEDGEQFIDLAGHEQGSTSRELQAA